MAEGSVDQHSRRGVRGAQQQLENLLGQAVVKMIATVNEELQNFAALNLATKADVARLEALIVSATTTSSGPAARAGRSVATKAKVTTQRRGPKSRQA